MSTYCYITYHNVLNLFLCITFCVLGVTDASSCAGGAKSDRFSSTTKLSNDECFDEQSDMQRENEEQVKTATQREDQQVSSNMSCECAKVKEKLPCEQQTGQLVKEVRSCLTPSVNSLHRFSAKPH